ncbi:MAG TPA: universal stress protein [Thermoplasmata archaeon]|nr:universal stress protein [Thermoplasmata archaeon]
MYRKIVVPVQVPAEVEPLVRFAAQLLEPGGEIRVLHVIPTTTLPQVTREWRASVNLVVPAHEVGAVLDVRVDPEVRAATDVPGEILESAETHHADAIVLTLRGDRRSRNPFVGHTATALLQHASSDVLVVNRLALASGAIPRVLVPTFAERPGSRSLALAEELSVKSGGVPVITLVLGGEAGAPGRIEGERTARGVPLMRRGVPLSGSLLGRRRRLPEIILQAAARERYGLLLVGEEPVGGGTLLTRRFLELLFRAAPCPVLSLRS